MPLPIIAGVVRCAVVGQTHGGDTWTNVWHWRYAEGASSPGTVEIDALHPILLRIYSGTSYAGGAPWFNACSTGVTLSRVDYTILNGSSLGYSKTATGAGSSGTSALPAQNAAVLTLRTDTRGRRTRGRIYFPAPSSAGTVITPDGHLAATIVQVMVAQAQGMATAAAAVQWKPVVASYGKSLVKDPNDKHDKIEVQWTPFATNVTNWTMDTTLDVQRRRKS